MGGGGRKRGKREGKERLKEGGGEEREDGRETK